MPRSACPVWRLFTLMPSMKMAVWVLPSPLMLTLRSPDRPP